MKKLRQPDLKYYPYGLLVIRETQGKKREVDQRILIKLSEKNSVIYYTAGFSDAKVFN